MRSLFSHAFASRGASSALAGSSPSRGTISDGASRSRAVATAFAVIAILLLAVTTSQAVATPGITNFWGSVDSQATTGGRFQEGGPGGVAVYESTGDVYVTDRGFDRVQQFDQDGGFIRAWGFDVDLPAAPAGAASFEVCTVKANCKAGVSDVDAAGGVGTAGEFSDPRGIAVNQSNGHVYVSDADFNRVQEFSSTGSFVRAFGRDVVFGSGGENAPSQPAQQSLTVDATAGQFKLTFQGQVTADIAFNAPASGPGGIQSALEGLSSIGAGNVTVTGGPGGSAPYTIAFTGALDNSPQPLLAASGGTTPLSGGAATAVVGNTQIGSSGFEICTVAVNCKAGVSGSAGGAFAAMGSLSVAPAGGTSPNAGNILVADAGNQRVQEFTAAGAFVRAFGWNVTLSGPGNTGAAFEVCRASAFDVCMAGDGGAGVGQFGALTPTGVAEDLNGNIYTVERSVNFRVQKFTLPGDVPTPQGLFDCVELCGTNDALNTRDSPLDVAVDGLGFVYVAKAFKVGTGTPPVEVAPSIQGCCSLTRSQPRVLRVDPSGNGGSGQVIDTMIANPGDSPGVEGDLTVSPGSTIDGGTFGLAPTAQGTPLYFSTSAGSGRARVYRLDNISGLAASAAVSGVKAATATLEGSITPATNTKGPVVTSYHFEYSRNGVAWLKAPVTDIVLGNGSAGGASSSCSIENQAATCDVSQDIDGLDLDQTYQYRLIVSTTYKGAVIATPNQEFTTQASRPTVSAGSAIWSGPPASGPSLAFNGRVNPQGARTSYAFEYVSQADFEDSGWSSARSVPSAAADAGHGVNTLDVTAVAAAVDPSSSYRFRLLASNSAGVETSDERTVAPPQAADRFMELVSAGDSKGASLPEQRLVISDDGERAKFIAVAFGEQPAAPYITNPNIASRGPSGWTVTPVGPDPTLGGSFLEGYGDSEVTKRLWLAALPSRARQWMVRSIDGSIVSVSPALSPLDRTGVFGGFTPMGGSADFSTIVFVKAGAGAATLLPAEPLVTGGEATQYSNIYKINGAGSASPTLSIVNRAVNGSVVGGACGARVGAEAGAANARTGAVSANGSVVYFSARAGTPAGASCGTSFPVRIFKRIADTATVEISACAKTPPATCGSSGDDYYWGASADGSRVYFSTSRQLTDSDTDSTEDLYLYDSSPPAGKPNLVQASAGQSVAVDHPTIGFGAGMLGAADISIDGSRAYFAATGRLTAQATLGENNLYVYQRDADHPDGRIGFVASLGSSGDDDLWSRVRRTPEGKPAYALPRYEGEGGSRADGSGHLLLFLSQAQLLPEDQDSSDDLYRYDDASSQLICLSCVGDQPLDIRLYGRGISGVDVDQIQQERIASEDGSKIVFTTREQLLPADINVVQDVYLWDAGELGLVSGATADRGVLGAGKDGVGGAAISPDGQSIFFLTRGTLLPQDSDNGGFDVYVARVGGGFPQQETPLGCATEVSCRASAPAGGPSDESPTPGSSTFSGPGNRVQPKPGCRRGKVRRKGHCVKPNKHKRRHHRRADDNRRASR